MSQYRVHVKEAHDVQATHVYVYVNAGGGAQYVIQRDGRRELLRYGESYNGEPTFIIPWEFKDEVLEALVPQVPVANDEVFATLHREQGRVDRFIEFLTGRDPMEDYLPLPTRGPDA